ncbi:hypothetical protein NMG60_11024806 [Bertholletia excelsa]
MDGSFAASNQNCSSFVEALMYPGKMPQLPAENASQLQEGIGLLLSQWSALQMAVQNEWGGPHSRLKSQQLAAAIFSWLMRSKEPLYVDDLKNMLDEFMLSQHRDCRWQHRGGQLVWDFCPSHFNPVS